MASYVYGTDPETPSGNLCLLPLFYAESASAEYSALARCSTMGEAAALSKTLKIAQAPGVYGEEDEVLDELADEPWEPWEYEDWPPAPAMVALNEVDADLLEALVEAGVGSEKESFPRGPRFVIAASSEDALVALVSGQGHDIVRNDSLIIGLS